MIKHYENKMKIYIKNKLKQLMIIAWISFYFKLIVSISLFFFTLYIFLFYNSQIRKKITNFKWFSSSNKDK